MKRSLLALCAVAVAARTTIAQLAPPPSLQREFRAAYITPIWDRGFQEFPSKTGLTTNQQQAELRAMFDQSAALGINAVVMHVRMAGDALYDTPFAPWAAYLSGTSGVGPNPAYDPLAFAVDEAHARGLQLHAWFNPFRAMQPIFAGKAAKSHVTRTHPEWIRKYGSETWIDPGEPEARKFVLETMLDVVKRYDVDGIHIDDYFYPYRESRVVKRRVHGKRVTAHEDIPFPDDKTWKKYGQAQGFTNRDAWRRSNIDAFIRDLYKSVKAIKPAMIVGISPFGIWRPGSPATITGLDAYAEIYADSKLWLAEGWLDYLAPQLYWELGAKENRFRLLDAWWLTINPQHRHIWPALYTSRVSGGREWDLGEIRNQITMIRADRLGTPDIPGHIHFRLAALFADNNRLASDLAAAAYSEPALVPDFPWLGSVAPAAPLVSIIRNEGPMSLAVTSGDTTAVRWWLIQTRGRDGHWASQLRFAGKGRISADAFGTTDPDEIAVTAIGVTGVASVPTLIAP